MQYPDDFLKNTSVQGRGDKRELDKIESPYLVRFGPEGVTRKKDDFTVFTPAPEPQELAEPYLYGLHRVSSVSNTVTRMIANPEASFGIRPTMALVYTYQGEYAYQSVRSPFVGDGYVIRMMRNNTDHNEVDKRWWPVMIRAKRHGDEAVVDGKKGQSISFINTWQMAYARSFSLVACGWDAAHGGYRFVLSAIVNSVPILFLGSTKDQTIMQGIFPTAKPVGSDFSSDDFNVFPLWRGALQYVRRCNFPSGSLTAPVPVICTSVDYGATWVTQAVPALEGYTSEAFDSSKTIIAYLGNNKSILIAAFKYPRSPAVSNQPMTIAFLGVDGGSYTRIVWPADDWPQVLHDAPVNNAVLLTQDWIRSAQFSFGAGCMYLPVIQGGLFKLMFTHDYGVTWAFSVEFPAALRGVGYREVPGLSGDVNAMPDGFAGVVVKPYVNEQNKGRLIFAYPDYATKRIVYLRTDGMFAKFTRVGSARAYQSLLATQNLPQLGADGINYTFTNYGGYIYPAFPREFDRP